MNENYTVFVHLVDSDGIVRGQKDNAPVNDTYPTSLWQPGEFVTDAYTLPLPPDLPPGDYAVESRNVPGRNRRAIASRREWRSRGVGIRYSIRLESEKAQRARCHLQEMPDTGSCSRLCRCGILSTMNHRPLSHIRILVACAVALVVLQIAALPSAAQADPAAEMLARINAVRVAQGLPPYAYSEKLAAAAQAHSKDMAAAGKVDRTGTDGSSPKSRILAAGYGQWTIGPVD